MRGIISGLLVTILLLQTPLLAGIPKDAALYIGGTVTGIPEQTEGRLDFTSDDKMIFRWKGGAWELPYRQVKSLEYGQKAGRRIGVAIAIGGWMALFSKKRRHFLTIGFEDAEGKKHAALIEIGKAKVRTSLAILEARAGLKVEYETEEAKKHVHG